MIDLHAHILPDADDGPGGWEEALRMLARAAADGITGMAATPHVTPGLYDNDRDKVQRLVAELRGRASGIKMEIYPGSELTACADTLDGLKSGRCPTLNSSRYVLVETPGRFIPEQFEGFVESLTTLGMVPLLAHPERSGKIQEDAELLYRLVRMGALTQLTAASFTGLFGADIKKFAFWLLECRLVHIVASDAHDDVRRPPVLSGALREIGGRIGERAARAMVETLPMKILLDETINVQEPHRPEKKSLFARRRFFG